MAPKKDLFGPERDEIFTKYGELRGDVHYAGYSFGRACDHLKWMLQGDRWRCAGRFGEVNAFMASLDLGSLQKSAEERAELARLIIAAQPTVTNRQIARTLGVSHSTINSDVGNNRPRPGGKAAQTKGLDNGSGKYLPTTISGEKAAKMVARKETAAADFIAKHAADEQRVLDLVPAPGKYRTLVIDPAWEYEGLSLAGRVQPAYARQSLDQLRGLDLRQWADDAGCHLYVWTTNNFILEAGKLIEHWGFQYRTVLTWLKPPPFGLGSYFRGGAEHVLFATLGDTTTRPAAASISTVFEAARGQHSEKPEAFYHVVRAASYPPYGEGNQRVPREGFANLFEPANRAAAAD
jgi:N6-adenosine-specific RNA methylase IME4